MIKKLIDLPSGHKAEAVYFEDDRKQVICFSTQLNCAVGCGFCASTKGGGKTINLSVDDMLAQVQQLDTADLDEMYGYYNNKPMLFSIMGEGEPFLNYNNVIKTMDLLQYRENCKIAVSTSGYKIRKFAHEKFKVPVKLQVSVHSADSRIRKLLVPNAPGVTQLVEDIAYYHEHNDGEVELNFTLVKGVNDTTKDMKYIAKLFPNEHIKLSGMNGHQRSELDYLCLYTLRDLGMSVEYQQSPGAEIAAACGMTRGEAQTLSYVKIYGKGEVSAKIMGKDLKDVFG